MCPRTRRSISKPVACSIRCGRFATRSWRPAVARKPASSSGSRFPSSKPASAKPWRSRAFWPSFRPSVFELTAPFNVAQLTALRIEVPAADAVRDSHSPEKGFIINHVDAWVVRPDGGADKIAFRLLAPDAVDALIGDIARDERNTE